MRLRRKSKRERQEKYDEGYVRGKRACLFGIFPIFIFLGIMMTGSWLIYDYYNKLTVNQDNSDICKLVRQHYPTTIRANYPCDLTEKGKFWIVSFNQNPGSTAGAPVFVTFKVDKNTKQISAGYDVN